MAENVDELILKAKEFINNEEFKKALDILEALYKQNPESNKIKDVLVDALFVYGGYLNDEYTLQYEEAKNMFKRIIKIDPANYRAHYNLGIANFNLEKTDMAKKCYEEALKIKPDYKHCYYNLGLIHESEGELLEALKYYEKALEIDPRFPYAVNARNQILSNLEELKKSKATTLQSQSLQKLKSLLEVSKRIKIEMIQTLLNTDKENVLDLMIEWGKKYEFEIDGDYINVNKKKLPNLLKSLEENIK
ncbi:MAG: tetratricopeptide repeat protein [Promethearchaeota archaeon]